MSRLVESLNLKIRVRLSYIFCDCEVLYKHQKKLIESVFKCPVYQVYGHTEGAAIGIQCRHSDYLHFLPQVGILELIKPDGGPASKEGENGEIVVTGFNNMVMPFIRYRTGDIGIRTNRKCSCGRSWPLLKEVRGRLQDYAIDKNGNRIAIAPSFFDYNLDWSGIDRFQIFQDAKGKLLIKIKILDKYSEKTASIKKELTKKLTDIFRGIFDVKVTAVDDIGFTNIGKFRYLDQKLDVSSLA
jgi:phenylacetate-CoA ligase